MSDIAEAFFWFFLFVLAALLVGMLVAGVAELIGRLVG